MESRCKAYFKFFYFRGSKRVTLLQGVILAAVCPRGAGGSFCTRIQANRRTVARQSRDSFQVTLKH